MADLIDLCFFGDLVGRPGREAVKHFLAHRPTPSRPTIYMANVENASHGFGLTQKNYEELTQAGVHIMTSGNHIWDRKDILDWVDQVPNLFRPHNFPSSNPGRGCGVVEVHGYGIGVINLIGQIYMGQYNSPWEAILPCLDEIKSRTNLIFIDFHGEATAEKLAFAHYVSQMGVSAFTGTHTHVQTADHRLLNDRMGYITDSGFCGAYNSVIGFIPETSIQRLKLQTPTRIEVSEETFVQINATQYTLDASTGKCTAVQRIIALFDTMNPAETMVSQTTDALYIQQPVLTL